jgi:hypothetical protein
MLNKKAKTLNENNSQLELALQKEIDMTNKTEKEITVFNIQDIVKVSNALAKRGEILQNIDYVDDFKFEKGTLYLHTSIWHMKGFSVSCKEANKNIDRSYEATIDNPFTIQDFKITHEHIRYED